ncbi:MAG: MFS transporter [Streptosporangiales bacterium]|nr:MFS transporter [Streptosporangiales bacterium]
MTEPGPDVTEATEAMVRSRRRWAAMAVLIGGFMLDLFNVTILNVGLPTVQADLGATPSEAGWIVTAYLLAFAASLITGARMGDLVGRKRVFLTGLVLFAAAGTWAGLVSGPGELIAARAVQGVAAGLLAPQVLASLYGLFDGRERATVFGLFGVFSGTAQAGGLLLGGVLIAADIGGLGWRSIFLISLPVAIVLVVLGAWLVPESRTPAARRPDLSRCWDCRRDWWRSCQLCSRAAPMTGRRGCGCAWLPGSPPWSPWSWLKTVPPTVGRWR